MRGNFFYDRLGRCLSKAREQRRLSQENVALLCEIDRTYISRIEKGRANPTVKTLRKIANALKIKLWRLLKNL
jgi:transcriptional regulator with XRE-family HTH domain